MMIISSIIIIILCVYIDALECRCPPRQEGSDVPLARVISGPETVGRQM